MRDRGGHVAERRDARHVGERRSGRAQGALRARPVPSTEWNRGNISPHQEMVPDARSRTQSRCARLQCRLGTCVNLSAHRRFHRPSVPFSRPTPRTAPARGVSSVIFGPTAPKLPEYLAAAPLRVDLHLCVRRCTERVPGEGRTDGAILASEKRHESAGCGTTARSLTGRRQLSATPPSGTWPAPSPARGSVGRARGGGTGRSAFWPYVMPAFAIKRNGGHRGMPVAVHPAGARRDHHDEEDANRHGGRIRRTERGHGSTRGSRAGHIPCRSAAMTRRREPSADPARTSIDSGRPGPPDQ